MLTIQLSGAHLHPVLGLLEVASGDGEVATPDMDAPGDAQMGHGAERGDGGEPLGGVRTCNANDGTGPLPTPDTPLEGEKDCPGRPTMEMHPNLSVLSWSHGGGQ